MTYRPLLYVLGDQLSQPGLLVGAPLALDLSLPQQQLAVLVPARWIIILKLQQQLL
jgi:hypothetical protein